MHLQLTSRQFFLSKSLTALLKPVQTLPMPSGMTCGLVLSSGATRGDAWRVCGRAWCSCGRSTSPKPTGERRGRNMSAGQAAAFLNRVIQLTWAVCSLKGMPTRPGCTATAKIPNDIRSSPYMQSAYSCVEGSNLPARLRKRSATSRASWIAAFQTARLWALCIRAVHRCSSGPGD